MAFGCGLTLVKYIVFAVNFIFFILGCLAVGLGITAIAKNSALEVLTEFGDSDNYEVASLLRTGAVLLIIGGVFSILLGFFGCCGAMKDSKMMLQIYSGIIVLVLILELAATIVGIVFSSEVSSKLKPILKERIVVSFDGLINSGDAFTFGVNFAQVKFECCGVDNYTDFDGADKWNRTLPGGNADIPPTCCKLKNPDAYYDDPSAAEFQFPDCQTSPSTKNSNWHKGCYQSIYDYGKSNATIVIIVGIAIIICEILCIIFAFCLIRAMKDQMA